MVYSNNSITALKSEQTDLVVSAVERFAQVIPLNIQEIFLWYFEQKGVDNPERFLAGVNDNGVNNQTTSPLQMGESQGEGTNIQNPENPITQNVSQIAQGADIETILNLVKLVYQYASENGGKLSELEKLVSSMEKIMEEK